MTFAPRRASSRAIAEPIPRPEPVTRATLPSRREVSWPQDLRGVEGVVVSVVGVGVDMVVGVGMDMVGVGFVVVVGRGGGEG